MSQNKKPVKGMQVLETAVLAVPAEPSQKFQAVFQALLEKIQEAEALEAEAVGIVHEEGEARSDLALLASYQQRVNALVDQATRGVLAEVLNQMQANIQDEIARLQAMPAYVLGMAALAKVEAAQKAAEAEAAAAAKAKQEAEEASRKAQQKAEAEAKKAEEARAFEQRQAAIKASQELFDDSLAGRVLNDRGQDLVEDVSILAATLFKKGQEDGLLKNESIELAAYQVLKNRGIEPTLERKVKILKAVQVHRRARWEKKQAAEKAAELPPLPEPELAKPKGRSRKVVTAVAAETIVQ